MKIDRLISIIMVLLNCEKKSATELAEMFEVSSRTIYRDIEAIELAGIPIFTTTGVNGGIGILANYKVDKQFFNPKELQSLLMGLSSVSTTLPSKEIAGVLEKVKSLIPEKAQNSVLKTNQVAIDLSSWVGNKKFYSLIESIKGALVHSKKVKFDYYTEKKISRGREVEPYQLVLKDGHWYLQAYCLSRKDFRVFKLSRMSKITCLEETFSPRGFNFQSLSGKGWIDKKLVTIKLLIDSSLREELVERCGEENIKSYKKNQFLVDLPFVEDEKGYNLLMGFGSCCECLSPKRVRLELIRRIKKNLKVYEV